MPREVSVGEVAARPTAVIVASTTWQEFPRLWRPLLDEVWDCLRAGGITGGCRNLMLYRDDAPNVEIGVELTAHQAVLAWCAVNMTFLPSSDSVVNVDGHEIVTRRIWQG